MGLRQRTSQIKRIARGKMLDKYGTAIGAYLLRTLILSAALFISSEAVDNSTTFGIITYLLMTIIVSLLGVTLFVGELTIYLNIACGNKSKAWDIFKGVLNNADKTILIAFIIMLRAGIYAIPYIVCYVLYIYSGNLTLGIATAMLGIFAAIMSIYVNMKLSQAYYILLDFPEMGAIEIIKRSTVIMRGNKWRLFRLYLSFIPLFLLGLLSLGLATLYIYPYIRMSLTEFYFDLMGREDYVKIGGGFDAYVDDSIELEPVVEKE